MGDVTRFPWEAPQPESDLITALQADLRYMVTHTAVQVRSNYPELSALVNMPRGEVIPKGQVRYTGGYTVELQDIGMPQPGRIAMNNINELLAHVHATALLAGLELEP